MQMTCSLAQLRQRCRLAPPTKIGERERCSQTRFRRGHDTTGPRTKATPTLLASASL
jgi:hypothetical protein